ncbi:hypothetical protein HMF8227_00706 [Saliniradius amylolyticus]|uniref:Uncharacterized protein n=1 Tax=Saliniradius amylolyticus TaxID=2183582 RepID=A0A2S2E0Z0_9ALTE|nr:DUF6170 family protein [Saliniradius amylolyticus]AWL11202.1 hypothetical protein HMF8227_00706 [Saliniradius amylolyticus]
MSYHISTRTLPGLESLSFRQRLAVIEIAAQRLTGIERLTLNLIKLLAIIGGFVCLYRVAEDWRAIFGVIVALLCYPLVLKPIYHQLCSKHIKQTDIEKVKQASEEG